MPLNDSKIRSLKPAATTVKHGDGGGLLLLVAPSGSKLWRMVYRFAGKQKQLAFGKWPEVSLADARAKREIARKLLNADIDPSQQLKVDRIETASSRANTFSAIADDFLAKTQKEGKAEATMSKKRWLISLADDDIGSSPISEITAREILVPLKRVEAQGNYETARRLRSIISQVFRHAIATSKVDNDPTFGLKGALITPKVKHRAALTSWKDYGRLIQAAWNYQGSMETCAALKLMALIYPRPGELRQAEWIEFDLENAVWTLPAASTKMRRIHKKPLPAMAVEVLRDLQRFTGNRRLVFPSTQSAERPMSENTINLAVRRMGFGEDEATAHGFRATASTLLNESGLWQEDAIEAELAHKDKNEVRRVYNRATYWEERVKMADWWAGEIAKIAFK
jgi:integrase